jgi:hypothetical protein
MLIFFIFHACYYACAYCVCNFHYHHYYYHYHSNQDISNSKSDYINVQYGFVARSLDEYFYRDTLLDRAFDS